MTTTISEQPTGIDKRSISDIINQRRVINGPEDKFRAISQVRYPWTQDLWNMMIENNWDVSQVSFLRDKEQFKELTPGQQAAYLRSTAFLSNLDAIQVDNLSNNVIQFITDPSIRSLLIRQTFEEAIHERAYSVMIEEVVPERTLEIYDMYRQVPQLATKNEFIINSSRQVTVDPTDINKVRAVVSNIALEGVYFYNGFLNFYNIGRTTGGFQGSVSNIEYIQRDETTHLLVFSNIWHALKAERPDLFVPELMREYREILMTASEVETNWGYFVIEEGVPGLTKDTMRDYPRVRADVCLKLMGEPPEYRTPNPVPWVDKHEKLNENQKNFFETKVVTYTESVPEFKHRKSRR